jgi:hypothetical protein
MARGSKKKYTSKQKRKASKIERGYKKRGVSSKEAERRAWATVNKSDKGGRKKGGGVAAKSEVNQVPARAVEKAAGDKALPVVLQKGHRSSSAEHLSLFRSASFPSCSLSAFFAESSAGLLG